MLHPIYYIVMIIITFFSYMEVSNNNSIKSRTKLPYIIIVCILILFAGIRVNQGADYIPYVRLYFDANKYVRWGQVFSREVGIEPTYVIISKIFGKLHLPFTFLLFTYAIISLSLRTYSFFKFSPYPFFSLLYFYMPLYFIQDMGHIRQGASIAFCLFSFSFIIKKKLFYYLLCLLMAYYFHKTAIVFLPAYWLANMRISTIKFFLILLTSIIVSPFEPYNWFGQLFQSLSADTISDAFSDYQELSGLAFSLGDIVKIILIIIILSFDNKIIRYNEEPNYMKVRNIVLGYFCLYYSFRENMIFSARLPESYGAFIPILVAMIIKNNKNVLNKYLLYLYFIIFLYFMSYRFWVNSQKVGFDKFNTIFSDGYNKYRYIPKELID